MPISSDMGISKFVMAFGINGKWERFKIISFWFGTPSEISGWLQVVWGRIWVNNDFGHRWIAWYLSGNFVALGGLAETITSSTMSHCCYYCCILGETQGLRKGLHSPLERPPPVWKRYSGCYGHGHFLNSALGKVEERHNTKKWGGKYCQRPSCYGGWKASPRPLGLGEGIPSYSSYSVWKATGTLNLSICPL